MTEYDYSSDAYERYLSTQRRIARWAEDTSRYHPSNPFLASPARDSSWSSISGSSYSPERSYSHTRHHSTSTSDRDTRPEPSRSYTEPTPFKRGAVESSSGPSRSTHHSRHSSRLGASHHSNKSNRSHSVASTFRTVTPNTDGPTYIKRSKSQSILVPIDGGRYVIIPAKGTRLEVMDQLSSVEAGLQEGNKSEKPSHKRLFPGLSLARKRD